MNCVEKQNYKWWRDCQQQQVFIISYLLFQYGSSLSLSRVQLNAPTSHWFMTNIMLKKEKEVIEEANGHETCEMRVQ